MSGASQAEPQKMGAEHVPRLLLLKQDELDKVIKLELEAKQKGLSEWYVDFKQKVLSLPLGGLAKQIRKWNSDGADNLCEKIEYCKHKEWFDSRLKLIEEISEERMVVADKAVEIISDIEGGSEIIEIAKEFASSFAEELFDYAVPFSLIIKIFKYGLDELCQCVDI